MAEPAADRTVHGLVAAHAATRPDAIAVQDRDQSLTYAELHTAAGGLAAHLADRGLRPGRLVLVSAPRSPALVVTLLAVLTAGGAYIAADHRWPAARLAQVARRADMTLVVGTAAGADLPGALHLPGDPAGLAAGRPPLTPPPVTGDDPFCVIFTSGSTGEPKGVLTLHGGTTLRLHGLDQVPLDEHTVMLQASPLPWDGLTLELWGPLVNGGRVVLHSGEPVTPATLRAARARGVNTMFLTGTLFAAIVQDDIAALGGFRQLLTGAERLSVRSVRAFLTAHPDGRLLHLYGPAEGTMYVTALELTPDRLAGCDDVPLGLPLPDTTVTVRGEDLRVLPDGHTGEICAGGPGLADGYLGDPEATAARFVHVDGERLYRTGDLGWIDAQHRLRFVGRADRQVKLRGNRLELQEVEAAMRREPAVLEAHAVVRTPASGAARLVGHYTTCDGRRRDAAVRAHCAAALPQYAVPAELRHHTRLPVTANGKVDLAALATLRTPDAPLDTDPVLGRLQRLAAELQGRTPQPGDDLVEDGLDSLTAMRLAYRVSRDFRVAFEVADLYAAGTLHGVAATIAALPPLPQQDATPATALRPAQYDWWLREQLLPGDPAAVVRSVFRVTGPPIPAPALAAAVRDIADRHDLLRTRFEHTADGPRLALLPPTAVCPLLTDDAPADLTHGLPRHWLAPFHLEGEPAWRVCLGRDRTGAGVVALVLHHWLIDGWSESVLVADLATALRARDRGHAPVWSAPAPGHTDQDPPRPPAAPLPALRRFWADHLACVRPLPVTASGAPAGRPVGSWTLRLAPAAPDPDPAPDPAGPPNGSAAEAVQARILAAWGAALAALPGTGTHLVAVAYAARDRVGDNALGCHVELIPLPLTASPDPASNAPAVAAAWRAGLAHRSLPLSEMLAGVRRDRRRQAVQTVFAFQTNPPARLDPGPGRTAVRVELPTAGALHPLSVEVWPQDDDTVTVRLEWDRRLVDDTWAEAMRAHLTAAVPRAGFRQLPPA